jgi:hypothetical protein
LEYEPTNTSWTTVRALLGDLCASLLTSVVYSFAFHKSERKPSVSTEGPPPTRGSHKRLNSIDGDDWEERPESLDTVPYGSKQNSADPSDQLTVSSDVNSRYVDILLFYQFIVVGASTHSLMAVQ